MEEVNSEVANLIVWAAEVAETVEKATNKECSTTRVLALHGIEKNKQLKLGLSNNEAHEKAKVIVANNLINGGKANEN